MEIFIHLFLYGKNGLQCGLKNANNDINKVNFFLHSQTCLWKAHNHLFTGKRLYYNTFRHGLYDDFLPVKVEVFIV